MVVSPGSDVSLGSPQNQYPNSGYVSPNQSIGSPHNQQVPSPGRFAPSPELCDTKPQLHIVNQGQQEQQFIYNQQVPFIQSNQQLSYPPKQIGYNQQVSYFIIFSILIIYFRKYTTVFTLCDEL